MTKPWNIETAERIQFSYPIASVGARILGFVIDSLVQLGIFILIVLLLMVPASAWDILSEFSSGFYFLLYFMLQWWYFLLFEWFMNGATPGKRSQKIRVIREDGRSLTLPILIIRNFLRVIDHFPIVPLIGGLVSMIHPRNKRLGDMAASTIVVKDVQKEIRIPAVGLEIYRDPALKPIAIDPPPGIHLNENQLSLIRDYLLLKTRNPKGQEENTRVLAKRVADALKITFPNSANPEQFLKDVYVYHAVPEQ